MYFGGLFVAEKDLLRPEYGGAVEAVEADPGLREEYLPLLDELTDSFYQRISTGMARYDAYSDTLSDYYRSLPTEDKPNIAQLRKWLRLQCSASESGKALYEAVRNDTAREPDYLLFAADVYANEDGGHTLLEQILLRTFCGAHPALARSIPLSPAEESGEKAAASTSSRRPVFTFSAQENSSDPRLLLLRWDEQNFAKAGTLELLQKEQVVGSCEIKNQSSPVQIIRLDELGSVSFDAVRFRVTRASGKETPQLLQLALWGLGSNPAQRTVKLLSTEEVAELCRYVNSLLSYGNGPRVRGNRNPTEQEILAYGEGHCGQFAYLFVKELSRRGVTDATVYGMVSRYYDNRSANHAVVEVETAEGLRVFDPTFGGWYLTDIRSLLTGENISEYAQGFESATAYYVTERFWKEVYSVSVITDQRNTYDTQLTGRNTVCATGLRSRVSYVKRDPKMDDRMITVSFRYPQSFYRIDCSFEESVPVMTFACVTVTSPDGSTETYPAHTVVTGEYSLEIQLDEPVEASLIELLFRTGAELPVLYTFFIYQ